MAIPRMRTAPGVLEAIREEDPETELTEHYIRYLIRAELVPVLKVGKKKLVSVDDVMEYLSKSAGAPVPAPAPTGEIRPVPVR